MFVGVMAFELIPHILLSFFNASEEMLFIGVPALKTISLAFITAGICIISGSLLNNFVKIVIGCSDKQSHSQVL